jgi:dTDP-4-dehydrorhamnose 3,5-epimerase
MPTRLVGPILLEPVLLGDERGFFLETFRRNDYANVGIDAEFVQDNHSRSRYGTIRALHFQLKPGQAKLVRVARGRAFDVVVDLRHSSPTFGKWESFELDDVHHRQLFVPIGFAHGFCAISDTVDFIYKVGSYYDPLNERGIAWDDPDLAIPWPVERPQVSERDRRNPRLYEIAMQLPEW